MYEQKRMERFMAGSNIKAVECFFVEGRVMFKTQEVSF